MTATLLPEAPSLSPADRYLVRSPEHLGIQTTVSPDGYHVVQCYTDLDGLLRQLRVEHGRTVGDPQVDPAVAQIFQAAGWDVVPASEADLDEEVIPILGGDPFATVSLPRPQPDRVTPQLVEQGARIAALEQQNAALLARLDTLLGQLAASVPAPDPGAALVAPVATPAPTVAEVAPKAGRRRIADAEAEAEHDATVAAARAEATGGAQAKREALDAIPQG